MKNPAQDKQASTAQELWRPSAHWPSGRWLLLAGDLIALFAGAAVVLGLLAVMHIAGPGGSVALAIEPRFSIYCVLAAALVVIFWAYRHYSTQPPRWRETGEITSATAAVAFVDVIATALLADGAAVPAQLLNWCIVLVLLLALRLALRGSIQRHPRLQPVLGVVPGGLADDLPDGRHYRLERLNQPLMHRRATGLVVDFHQELSDDWMRLLGEATAKGRPVLAATDLYEDVSGRVSLKHLNEGYIESLQPPRLYQVAKRGLDALALAILVPPLAPLMASIALAIKLESRGPVLFRQPRVGHAGEIFTLVKFRSMCEPDPARGYGFADEDADRITRVGAFLRASHLDELPQLWNIFKGDMTLIGPRPEFVSFAREFEGAVPLYRYRYAVRPGVTGWAQVLQGSTSGTAAIWRKLEHDLYYIKNMSPWLDLAILVLTAWKLVPWPRRRRRGLAP